MLAVARAEAMDGQVSPAQALAMYLCEPSDPGGSARRVEAGVPADLCLLKVPLTEALTELSADLVQVTISAGQVVYAQNR